jgi:hypothetical protein
MSLFNDINMYERTCVGTESTIRGTEFVKHQFYSIRPKMMFRSVSEHFDNLLRVKRCKTFVLDLMHYFGAPKL